MKWNVNTNHLMPRVQSWISKGISDSLLVRGREGPDVLLSYKHLIWMELQADIAPVPGDQTLA